MPARLLRVSRSQFLQNLQEKYFGRKNVRIILWKLNQNPSSRTSQNSVHYGAGNPIAKQACNPSTIAKLATGHGGADKINDSR